MSKKGGGGSAPAPVVVNNPQPAPVDPTIGINAQLAANKQSASYAAALNRVNEYTPYGSMTYQQDGADGQGNPIYSSRINLTPQAQQQLDLYNTQNTELMSAANQFLPQIQQLASQPYDFSKIPALISDDDLAKDAQNVQDAQYHKQTALLDPQYTQQENLLNSQLINQGIMAGSEADTNARGNFARQRDYAYGNARDSSILAGEQEQSRLYGLSLSKRQQAIQEYNTQRETPLNEFNALRGASQIQQPQFTQAPQVSMGSVDAIGAYNAANAAAQNLYGINAGINQNAYNGQMNAYNQRIGQQNSFQGGLMGLGGTLGAAAIKASDERLKENAEPIGALSSGINIYRFNYIGDPTIQIGVMAQEVLPVIPDAVLTDADGYYAVDYSKLR